MRTARLNVLATSVVGAALIAVACSTSSPPPTPTPTAVPVATATPTAITRVALVFRCATLESGGTVLAVLLCTRLLAPASSLLATGLAALGLVGKSLAGEILLLPSCQHELLLALHTYELLVLVHTE